MTAAAATAATAATAVKRPIPLFGAFNQVEKCIQVLLRQSKRGHLCFTFALESENFKVSYSQKGMKKSRRPKTIFHHYPDLEHDEHDEHDEENDEEMEEMDETSGRVSPHRSNTPSPPPPSTHHPSYKNFGSGWTTDTKCHIYGE